MSRSATILKLAIQGARATVDARFRTRGSVLAATLRSWPEEVAVALDIESSEPAERVRRLLQTAHESCFVETALRQPVRLTTSDRLNGREL